MKTDFEAVVSIYFERYAKIFRYCYPAHGSTGFTERNQSVNFSSAMEEAYHKSFTWFEVPFGKANKEHFDAVICNFETREIFIVESKRFSNPQNKLKKVASDIIRITDENHINSVKGLLRNCDVEEFQFYGVILSDIWLETKQKVGIYQNWDVNLFTNIEDISEAVSRLQNVKWFKSNNLLNSNLDDQKWIENYRLLVMVGQVFLLSSFE